jgi:hypothetical protein
MSALCACGTMVRMWITASNALTCFLQLSRSASGLISVGADSRDDYINNCDRKPCFLNLVSLHLRAFCDEGKIFDDVQVVSNLVDALHRKKAVAGSQSSTSRDGRSKKTFLAWSMQTVDYFCTYATVKRLRHFKF